MKEGEEVTVLRIAGEGGGITLLGRRKADGSGWEFARKTVDHSMAMLGTDEGEEGQADPEYKAPTPVWVGGWREAMGLLDRYPWAMLVPIEVHPDFKEDILVEATRWLIDDPSPSAKRRMQAWLERCL